MKTHWDARSQQWSTTGSPLQPNQEVIDYFLSQIPSDQHILLLGVTRQVAEVYQRITAVDYSPSMIQRVWVGNSTTKTAVLQNWLDYRPNQPFSGIIGDASINMLHYPTEIEIFFARLPQWLAPNGKFVCRVFTRFDEPVTLDRIHSELHTMKNFNAWRRLLNMYLAEQSGPLVKHSDTLALFNQLFPDRDQLPWPEDMLSKMDAYKDTTTSTWFPTRKELLSMIPEQFAAEFVDVGSYDHHTAYPILVCKIQDHK